MSTNFTNGDNMYRHGDILITSTKLPSKAKTIHQKGDYVVALGEHTGHKHTLTGTKFIVLEYDGRRFIDVTEPTELTHEEHKTLTIEPGTYEIGAEREYDYFSQEVAKVQD